MSWRLSTYCNTLSFPQTPDEHWKISCETAIKARSVTGYTTSNRKMIINKFFEGEPKGVSDGGADSNFVTSERAAG